MASDDTKFMQTIMKVCDIVQKLLPGGTPMLKMD
jgi:hypothetical protein